MPAPAELTGASDDCRMTSGVIDSGIVARKTILPAGCRSLYRLSDPRQTAEPSCVSRLVYASANFSFCRDSSIVCRFFFCPLDSNGTRIEAGVLPARDDQRTRRFRPWNRLPREGASLRTVSLGFSLFPLFFFRKTPRQRYPAPGYLPRWRVASRRVADNPRTDDEIENKCSRSVDEIGPLKSSG